MRDYSGYPCPRPSGHQQKTLMLKFAPGKFVELDSHPSPIILNFFWNGGNVPFQKKWRRMRDSNPRNLTVQRFSRPPLSTTQPTLQIVLYFHSQDTASGRAYLTGFRACFNEYMATFDFIISKILFKTSNRLEILHWPPNIRFIDTT